MELAQAEESGLHMELHSDLSTEEYQLNGLSYQRPLEAEEILAEKETDEDSDDEDQKDLHEEPWQGPWSCHSHPTLRPNYRSTWKPSEFTILSWIANTSVESGEQHDPQWILFIYETTYASSQLPESQTITQEELILNVFGL
jgi:hypothetical protein